MATHPYPMTHSPTVTNEGGSKRVTIPIAVCEELEIEKGDSVENIRYNKEDSEITLVF